MTREHGRVKEQVVWLFALLLRLRTRPGSRKISTELLDGAADALMICRLTSLEAFRLLLAAGH